MISGPIAEYSVKHFGCRYRPCGAAAPRSAEKPAGREARRELGFFSLSRAKPPAGSNDMCEIAWTPGIGAFGDRTAARPPALIDQKDDFLRTRNVLGSQPLAYVRRRDHRNGRVAHRPPDAMFRRVRWLRHGGQSHMAGRVGPVQRSRDGESYGFVIYDEADRACAYFGFSSWHEADNAARQAQSLLVTAMRCLRR